MVDEGPNHWLIKKTFSNNAGTAHILAMNSIYKRLFGPQIDGTSFNTLTGLSVSKFFAILFTKKFLYRNIGLLISHPISV